jgi:hypothetical protein
MKKLILCSVFAMIAIAGFKLFNELMDPNGYQRQRAARLAVAKEWHDPNVRRKNECEFWKTTGIGETAACDERYPAHFQNEVRSIPVPIVSLAIGNAPDLCPDPQSCTLLQFNKSDTQIPGVIE